MNKTGSWQNGPDSTARTNDNPYVWLWSEAAQAEWSRISPRELETQSAHQQILPQKINFHPLTLLTDDYPWMTVPVACDYGHG
jgi:hypothetical protein